MDEPGLEKVNVKNAPHIDSSWREILISEFQSPYFQSLKDFLIAERKVHTVYPKGKDIFNAFNSTPFDAVKVVLLGQDPYHGPGQAHGLCFSVREGIPFPPSLRNIFKELNSDLGVAVPQNGDLSPWAREGVLLLNATLTVRAHHAGSHQGKGWEKFTDSAIYQLSTQKSGLIFLLWGRSAQSKKGLIDASEHYILEAPHPSPLSASRGFFGCRHFSMVNSILEAQGKAPISWELD